MNYCKEKHSNRLIKKCVSGIRLIPIWLPIGIALLLVIPLLIFDKGSSGSSVIEDLLLLISLTLLVIAGILIIIRREIPRLGLPSIKGIFAVIGGIMMVFVTTFLILLVLIDILK